MTNRRKRLYVAALVRAVLPTTYGAECDAVEAYADRRITYAEFRAAHLEALQRHGVTDEAARDSIDVKRKRWLLGDMFHREAEQGRGETRWHLRHLQPYETPWWRFVGLTAERVLQCIAPLRYAVPSQHVTADVRRVALAIYDDKDFAAMPILADALEDAGLPVDCSAMWHCRSGEPHWRGCCVLDSILGRLDK